MSITKFFATKLCKQGGEDVRLLLSSYLKDNRMP
jgi:hypothetical protein